MDPHISDQLGSDPLTNELLLSRMVRALEKAPFIAPNMSERFAAYHAAGVALPFAQALDAYARHRIMLRPRRPA